MRSPIQRVYMMLAVALIAPMSVVSVALRTSYDRATERQFYGILGAHAGVVRRAVAEAGGPSDSLLPELSEQLGAEVRWVEPEELGLSLSVRQRLDEGEVVVRTTWMGVMGLVPVSGRIAQVGPFERVLPLGGERALLVLLLVSGSTGLAIYLVIRPLDRQLSDLGAAARRFGEGDLSARAVPMGQDPAGVLAERFNQMAERIGRLIDNQRALLHAVSHELRTPLARLRFGVALLDSAPDAGERARRVEALERDVAELDELVGELLQYLRLEGGPTLERAEVDLRGLLAEVIGAVLPLRPEVELELECAEQARVSADPRLLRRATQNLVSNAVKYTRDTVVLTATVQEGRARLVVDDDGPGVPAAERARVFEPFVRLHQDPDGPRGVGLGLAIVARIAAAHGGAAWVEESPLGGARFVLELPAS